MDNTAKGFAQKIISELEHLVAGIRSIQEHLQNPGDRSPGNKHSVKQQHGESNATVTPSIARADHNPKPSVTNSDTTYQKYTKGLQEAQPWVQTVGVMILIVYTSYAGCQTSAVRQANKIAQNSVIGGQRPWIGVDPEPGGFEAGPLKIDTDETVSVVTNIRPRNFGTYPGQGVFAGVDLIITQTTTAVKEQERKVCSETHPDNVGDVIFLGRSSVTWHWPAIAMKNQFVRVPGGDQYFRAYIVGCIWYLDQVSKPHYTGFSYQLGMAFDPKEAATIQGQWVPYHGYVDQAQ